MSEESIDEIKKKVRVSASGKKTKRIRCKPGFKLAASGNSCVKQDSSEKIARKKAAKKAARKRRSKSQAGAKRKRLKALKKRKNLGYKRGR